MVSNFGTCMGYQNLYAQMHLEKCRLSKGSGLLLVLNDLKTSSMLYNNHKS